MRDFRVWNEREKPTMTAGITSCRARVACML